MGMTRVYGEAGVAWNINDMVHARVHLTHAYGTLLCFPLELHLGHLRLQQVQSILLNHQTRLGKESHIFEHILLQCFLLSRGRAECFHTYCLSCTKGQFLKQRLSFTEGRLIKQHVSDYQPPSVSLVSTTDYTYALHHILAQC